MGRVVTGFLLFFSLLLWAADVPTAPQFRPEDYPPGTIFSVVYSPTGKLAWAPSQDPDFPPVRKKDGTLLPILPYEILDLPTSEAREFGVVRSGGHYTLAQILFYQASSPEDQKAYRDGTKMITRDMLRGYVATTVKFQKMKSGAWGPDVVSWKSLQINVNNHREWKQAEPPFQLQVKIFHDLAREVNGLPKTEPNCGPEYASLNR